MSSSGKIRGWTAATAAGAVLAGVSTLPLPPPEAPPAASMRRITGQTGLAVSVQSPEEAVRELLAQRTAAVRAGDEESFAATVDPKAPPDFRRRQHDLFRNLKTLPATEWDYELDSETGRRPPVAGADETWAPEVVLRYGLTGVDTVPTERELGYVFARRGASWYLADTEPHAWRGPWDFGLCKARRAVHGLVIGHRPEPVERVARQLDAAVADVTEVWGPGWSQRVGVLLPESPEELRSLVGPEFAVEGIAAVTVADRVDNTTRRVEGPRVVLTPKAAGELSDTALRAVLRHEITHIAVRADTVDGSPMWMVEGFADYVGYRESGVAPREIAPDLVRQIRRSGPPARLPADNDFHSAAHRLELAYQQSWSFIRYLADRLGEPRLLSLYRRIAATTSHSEVDKALLDATGRTTTQLTADWATYLRRTFG